MNIDGKQIASDIRKEVASQVAEMKKAQRAPGLAVVLVGENPASISYVTAKERACEECGVRSFPIRLPATTSQAELLAEIDKLNANDEVDGILVQHPLPKGLDEQAVIHAIAPEKDVDGFHPVSLGKLVLGLDTFVPCTPAGIMELLDRSGVDPSGKHAVVIGRSNIVGKPISLLLARKGRGANATVTMCHTGTKYLAEFTRAADILIVASGCPHTVTKGMIKKDAVVIDVGVNRIEDASRKSGFRLIGDVDYDDVAPDASLITPVPGGVGPMTIAMLLKNTVKAAMIRLNYSSSL